MNERRPLAPVTGLKRTTSLPPPPARRTAPTTAAPADPPKRPVQVATAPPTARTTATPKRSPRSADADTIRPISLSLPLSLADALKSRSRSSSTTQADVLMDAIVSEHDRLGLLIEEAQPHPTRDALFVRAAPKKQEETYVSLSLRMLARNVATLDSLVTEHGGDSRSQLCAVALAAYLLG